jgi:hypothetical protein
MGCRGREVRHPARVCVQDRAIRPLFGSQTMSLLRVTILLVAILLLAGLVDVTHRVAHP